MDGNRTTTLTLCLAGERRAMGTGSYDEVELVIKGKIHFDLEESPYEINVFRKELELLCTKYGLQIEDKEQ